MTAFTFSAIPTVLARQVARIPVHLVLAVTVLGLMVLPDIAAASSPSFSLDTILPSSLTDKPFLTQVVTVIVMVVLSATFIILGFGVMGGVADVFSSMTEARRMGDWGGFMKTLAMVIGVVIVGVVLAVMIYTWLTTITINPTVKIGG